MTQATLSRSAGVRLRLLALLPLLALAAPLAPGAEAASSSPVQGVDVSKYQHDDGKPIDWGKVRRSGQTFAFIKATGGSDRTDPWYARESVAARRAGMIVGAYHYADPRHDADAQAAHIVDVVGTTREANDLGIVLDLESSGGLSPSRLSTWAHTFLTGVERRTGRLPILYTGPHFWHTKMKDNKTFGAYPLWIAHYTDKRPGPLPGWDRWTFWQRTSSARVSGIVGLVDHDLFCCPASTLAALADGRSTRITRVWRQLGGASGTLGLPLGPETPVPTGWGQTFERGYVAATAQGTFSVTGPVWERYRANGGAKGALGIPVGPARVAAPGVTEQRFAGGRIVHSAATGAHSVIGVFLARWVAEGGPTGPLGLPTGELSSPSQQFTGGGLYSTEAGVRLVPDTIRDHYEERGGPDSVYGLPTNDARPVLGGRLVTFDVGLLLELDIGGQRIVV